MSRAPAAPRGLRAPGRRLWRSITDEYELDEHEMSLLVEAVRTVDVLDLLDAQVRDEGPIISSPQGPRANPALVEARAQRITLARLLAVLRLPTGEAGDTAKNTRPQRRSGARGAYGIRGAV